MFALSESRRSRVSRRFCHVAALLGKPSGSYRSDAAGKNFIYGTICGLSEIRHTGSEMQDPSFPTAFQGFFRV